MPVTFLIGGARSGKSQLAVSLVTALAAADGARAAAPAAPVVTVVTAEPGDDEMHDRIARHRAERPAGWHTVEAPRRLATSLAAIDADAIVLLDCLSFWVANLVMDGVADAAIEAEAAQVAAWARARRGTTVIVSNEVGSGLVPDNELGRRFRDVLGRANATVSTAADTAWLVVAGRALALAPSHTVLDAVTGAGTPDDASTRASS